MKKVLLIIAVLVALSFLFITVEPAPLEDGKKPSDSVSVFEAVAGMAVFLSFLTAIFCAVSLWFQIDRDSVKKEGGIVSVLKSMRWTLPIPPERLLTTSGIRTATVGKIAMIVFASTAALLIARGVFIAR